MTAPAGHPASPERSRDTARAAVIDGAACIVDVRPVTVFAAAHPRGAISLAHSEKGLSARLKAILPPGTSIVLLADDINAESARCQLAAGGWTVIGTLGGPQTWGAAGLVSEGLEIITSEDLAAADENVIRTVIDVREPLEWTTGHVPGAILIPLAELPSKIGSLDPQVATAVICESGTRSSTAASLLQRASFKRVANVVDGSAGYRRSGRPLAFPGAS